MQACTDVATRSVSSAWRAAICERATGWVQPRSAPRTRASTRAAYAPV